MPLVGRASTVLIVLRGNSASGKSSAAAGIRAASAGQVAIVAQDVIRRQVLKEPDVGGGDNIGLIDLMARYCLDRGYHVVIEGILSAQRYGEMLETLRQDHRGRTHAFYWDVSFAETLRRHASKPIANEVSAETMRGWYRDRDVLGIPGEVIIPESMALDEAVATILSVCGLAGPQPERHA